MRGEKNGFSRRLFLSGFLALTASAATPPGPPPRWLPPPQGAVEMFRQMPRAFAVGGGGAGGEVLAAAAPDAGAGQEGRGVDFVVNLAPLASWDALEGPTAHLLPEGTVRLYRPGAWRPERVGRAGEVVELPPGEWWLTADAPGFASTAANRIPVGARREKGRSSFVAAVAPACRVELAPRRDWQSVERVDVVSLTEGAVYPVAPRERTELWVPAGDFLAYTLAGDRLDAVGEVHTCRAGEAVTLARPLPPRAGRGSLLLSLELPRSFPPDDRTVVASLTPTGDDPAARGAVRADTMAWQGRRVTYFFLDVPETPLAPIVEHSALGPLGEPPRAIRGIEHIELIALSGMRLDRAK